VRHVNAGPAVLILSSFNRMDTLKNSLLYRVRITVLTFGQFRSDADRSICLCSKARLILFPSGLQFDAPANSAAFCHIGFLKKQSLYAIIKIERLDNPIR